MRFNIQKFLVNPLAMFVHGILAKWYVMIGVASLVVSFWVFKGLESAGVLSAANKVVYQALTESKAVAKYCVPKIGNIQSFIECIEHPPQYDDTEDKALENVIIKNSAHKR